MGKVKVYVNVTESSLKILRLHLTDSIKDYSAHVEIDFLNPKGQYSNSVKINDEIRIDLYDSATATWIKRFEGYATKVDADPQKHRLKVQAISWNGRLQERHLNEVYEHEELSQIIRDICSNHLGEFAQEYINQTGTAVVIQENTSSDGTIQVASVGHAIAQRFTANELENVFKVRINVFDSNSARVDVELREDNAGEPGELLKIRSNVMCRTVGMR